MSNSLRKFQKGHVSPVKGRFKRSKKKLKKKQRAGCQRVDGSAKAKRSSEYLRDVYGTILQSFGNPKQRNSRLLLVFLRSGKHCFLSTLFCEMWKDPRGQFEVNQLQTFKQQTRASAFCRNSYILMSTLCLVHQLGVSL